MMISWIPADWPVPESVVAGTALRGGGVSVGAFESLNLAAHVGDDETSVLENRRRFRTECALPSEPVWLRQVHGAEVLVAPYSQSAAGADGIVSHDAGVVCVILSADCLPVLFATSDGTSVAAAHAGWRGLCAGVLEKTVGAMNVAPERIVAWLGPAISQSAFEVGTEVREQFLAHAKTAEPCFTANDRGRWQADLYGLARLRLGEAGIRHIFGGALCTHSDQKRFFSYRRDGECGRMASIIFRKEGG